MANKVFNFTPKQNSFQIGRQLARSKYKDIDMVSDYNHSLEKYSIGDVVDVEAVKVAMRNLFNFIPGERVLEPNYGNTVLQYLYNGITETTKEQIAAEVSKIISKYEPRAQIDSLQDITTTNDEENNTVQLKMVWHVVGLDSQKYELMIGV